jgi:hypothetical protein
MKKYLLMPMIIIVFIGGCADPTRCDNGGCDYRKAGYYLMKEFPSMGAGHYSRQRNFSWSEHAFRKKEFCSAKCGNDYYKKL